MFKKSNTLNEKGFREWLKSPHYSGNYGCFSAVQFPTDVQRLALGDPRMEKSYGSGCPVSDYFIAGTKQHWEITRATKDCGRLETEFSLQENGDTQMTMIFLEKHNHVEFFRISVLFAKKDGFVTGVTTKGEVWSAFRERRISDSEKGYVLTEHEGKIVSIRYVPDPTQIPSARVDIGDVLELTGNQAKVTIECIVEPWISGYGHQVFLARNNAEEPLVRLRFEDIKPKSPAEKMPD